MGASQKRRYPPGIYTRPDSSTLWFSFKLPGKLRVREPAGTEDVKKAVMIRDKAKAEAQDIVNGFARPKITLGKLLDDYLADPEIKALDSWKCKRDFCERLKKFFGDGTSIFDLKVKRLKEYRPWRETHGERKAEICFSTINRELAELRHAFNMLYALYEIEDYPNPVAHLDFPREDERRRVRFLNLKEKQAILSATSGKLRKLTYFALKTGMRQGEILAARWEDVNFETNLIYVPLTKTHNPRHIPMPAGLAEMLKIMPSESEFIFGKEDGTQSQWWAWRKEWRRAVKAAKIKNFVFHDLRHTYASDLIQRGVKLERIQVLLGHKDFKTTQRYAHLVPDDLQPEVQKLSGIEGQACHESVTELLESVLKSKKST